MPTDLLERAHDHLRRMQPRKALRLFVAAESEGADPDLCAAGRWTCHMLAGNFHLAWRESDAIAARGRPDPHRFWDGRPLKDRRILLRCLHGLGDTIQFIRFAPLIRQQARSLTIEAQPLMKRLLEQCQIADEVITWGEREPAWDQQIEVMELPRIFRVTLGSIPDLVPYLHPADTVARCSAAPHTLQVGLVWRSSSYNPERSVPLENFASLLNVPGASFFSLQAGVDCAEFAPWSGKIVDLYDESGCVSATAAAIKALDLVISVDTMVAHLAGALGRPVWTLLPYECDWRWMLDRDDSPWYPTMRLFRQKRRGDWDPVLERVRNELNDLVQAKQVSDLDPRAAPVADLKALDLEA